MQNEDDTKTAAGDSPIKTPSILQAADIEQVLEVQKLESLGLLAGGIAHDFNNILTGVLGSADLALSSLAPDMPGRDHLVGIRGAARRAADLARELLAYSGKAPFEIEPLDLSQLIDETKQLVSVSLANKPRIIYELERGVAAVEADRTQLRQILLNLITNSSEAIHDPNGSITVRTGAIECDADDLRNADPIGDPQPGAYVFLEVSDSGIGMDEETRRKLFQPFFSTKGTGRGLGLAAVMGIVQRHGGVIRVMSRPGTGTTTRVLLPASEKPAAASVPARVDNGTWTGGGTVLVIDDEEPIRSVATRMLQALGFEVLSARDGGEGVDAFRCFSSEIGLVLVDLTMPGLSGVEAIRELRALRADVKTVLMSGYRPHDIEKEYAADGITAFLEKPFGLEQLRECVRGVLESSGDLATPGQRLAEPDDEEQTGLQRDLSAYRKLSSEIKLAHYDVALRLTREAEERSGKLAGRLNRISRLATELARELEVSEDGIRVLAAAAPFHDIGKVELPPGVLRKPGPLSDKEWEVVKSHPAKGSELLSGLCSRVIEAGAEIALTHHERWDGSGYPFGLAGKEIPLFGRIVSLADSYDALRSPRPYKEALDHQAACSILLEGGERTRPGHFDPEVLAAFDRARGRFAEIFDTIQGDDGRTACRMSAPLPN